MSKKESEFDRYERMRKLEREAEVEKRKNLAEGKKRGGRLKPSFAGNTKIGPEFIDEYGDDEYY